VAGVKQLSGGGCQVTMTGAELAENSRLREEIEALALPEASTRSPRETVSEIDRAGESAPVRFAELDRFNARAAFPLGQPRRRALWPL